MIKAILENLGLAFTSSAKILYRNPEQAIYHYMPQQNIIHNGAWLWYYGVTNCNIGTLFRPITKANYGSVRESSRAVVTIVEKKVNPRIRIFFGPAKVAPDCKVLVLMQHSISNSVDSVVLEVSEIELKEGIIFKKGSAREAQLRNLFQGQIASATEAKLGKSCNIIRLPPVPASISCWKQRTPKNL